MYDFWFVSAVVAINRAEHRPRVLRDCHIFANNIACKFWAKNSNKIYEMSRMFTEVQFRFEPQYFWLNFELDFRFGSDKTLNLGLNIEFGSADSGSNLGSEPNCSITTYSS